MEPGGAGRARDIAPTKPREDGGTNLRRAGNLPARRPGEAPAWLLPLIAVAALAPACSPPPGAHPHAPAARPAPPPPILFDNLGTYGQKISTASPEAQAFFDQGLRLVYAFNHLEAQYAFREAARLDPACAMCWWGIALTYGSNYNSPTDPDRERGAWEAIQKARYLAGRATPRERATIDALAERHSASPEAERAALDRAYADAMRETARSFPGDPDAATLFADAMMNLRPWALWTEDGRPQPGTEEIVATLERVLATWPDHPGALHLYIHAVEASPSPRRGEAAADRLRTLMPGAGHIVHMPSHIYYRIGRYADAVTVNQQAVQADLAYFKVREASPAYRMGYYPHNIDFVWLAASMEGRGAETIRAAREFAAAVPVEHVREMPEMESAPAAPLMALARFGRWPEILAQPAPPEGLPYVRGIWHYARGLAFLRSDRRDLATGELARLEQVKETVPPDRLIVSFFKTRDMLGLASDVLAGEIAAREGDIAGAVRHLDAAIQAQDRQWFTEPPPWYFPVRQALGAVLLQGARAGEAEAVYREDLRRNPDNGWSLYGLARSLRAQGRASAAADAEAQFRRAWSRADVVLTASRF